MKVLFLCVLLVLGASAQSSSQAVASSPVASSPVASSPAASSPVASSPVASSPVASSPVASSPVASSPVASSPVASSPVASSPVASSPVASSPVASSPAVSPSPSVAKSSSIVPPVSSSVVPPVSSVNSYSSGECEWDAIQCIDSGDDAAVCYGDFYHLQNGTQCKYNCCPIDYYCINGKCITDTDGDQCTYTAVVTTNNCTSNAWGTHITGCVHKTDDDDTQDKCHDLMNAGDTCDDKNYCVNGMDCTKDRCAAKGENETCQSYGAVSKYNFPPWAILGQDCERNYYCDPAAKVCTKMLEEDDACVPWDLPFCGMNLVCDLTQGTNGKGKCVKMFSVKKDGACKLSMQFTCEEDLYCKKKAGATDDGTCQTASKDKYTKCHTDADCDDNTTCVCTTNGEKYCTQHIQAPCCTSLKAVYKCFDDNECTTGILSQNEDSCSQINCAQELSDYRTCTMCEQYDMKECISDHEKDTYCPAAQLETWEKLTILAVIVVVVIVIIVVITACCCCSKRKEYQPI